jgi:hypothetical protein
MAKLFFDLSQGSTQWYEMHSKIPTASNFDLVLTPKTAKISERRHDYAIRIIAARLMNWQADSLNFIKHVEDGTKNEARAVAAMELIHEIETKPLGFATTADGRFGASPDRVVMRGDHVGITVEIKAPQVPAHLKRLLLGHADEYRCQVAGQLFVTEADKAIFTSWHERMPLYMTETGRDEPFIAKLKDALEQFSDELEALQAKAVSLGAYQAFQAIVPPAEAEYGDRPEPGSPAELDALVAGMLGNKFGDLA